ncbi:hypothetical protein SLEP1_g8569 [Rubroshorea leprosula]|uniref:TSL-kinase interacting protein 1 n=1 Tax=Rubroshorea leprosula TaxID=152421 RepID=A0AAV5IAF2_9ROSI|nr:hypothetical protein SLEP1_g8569 [Rubroshorea leprosula]
MKTSRKRRSSKEVEAPTVLNVGGVVNEAKKSVKGTSRESPKARSGVSQSPGLVEKCEHPSPSGSDGALYSVFQDKSTCFLEAGSDIPAQHLHAGQTFYPSTKMKLQLFPIDEGTRLGLEKDGFHPYLELTLSARKKVSSILKHLSSKWGNSSIAVGEPMLFPYNVAENLSTYRWSVNDVSISARDVYTTTGRPAVFRLRYGWVSDSETKSTRLPLISASFEACLNCESVQRDCNNSMEIAYGKGEKTEMTNEEIAKPAITSTTHAVMDQNMFSDLLVDSTDNEARMASGIGQPSTLWDDSLTNISIGGLLSEASLQGKFKTVDPKSNGSNAGMQPSQLISDSFDAFLAGQINQSEAPRLPTQDACSSIFNAEDTCHAFLFQKYSSSAKDAIPLGGSACPRTHSQDASSKSFTFPNLTEANSPSELPEGQSCQGSEKDLLLCSRVYNDESSLGLSGIKWTESLGPFDLGLSSSRRIIAGENTSISGVVN